MQGSICWRKYSHYQQQWRKSIWYIDQVTCMATRHIITVHCATMKSVTRDMYMYARWKTHPIRIPVAHFPLQIIHVLKRGKGWLKTLTCTPYRIYKWQEIKILNIIVRQNALKPYKSTNKHQALMKSRYVHSIYIRFLNSFRTLWRVLPCFRL
jgi:hypothetical protein